MSYQEALEAAGAEVLKFAEFGSYQGDWWAKVKHEGIQKWVNGSYGSCSGCDSFQGEFGYSDGECDEHEYYYDKDREEVIANCDKCKIAKREYQERLADFGKPYLDGWLTQEEAERDVSRNLEWDSNAKEMLEFIRNNRLD